MFTCMFCKREFEECKSVDELSEEDLESEDSDLLVYDKMLWLLPMCLHHKGVIEMIKEFKKK